MEIRPTSMVLKLGNKEIIDQKITVRSVIELGLANSRGSKEEVHVHT